MSNVNLEELCVGSLIEVHTRNSVYKIRTVDMSGKVLIEGNGEYFYQGPVDAKIIGFSDEHGYPPNMYNAISLQKNLMIESRHISDDPLRQRIWTSKVQKIVIGNTTLS